MNRFNRGKTVLKAPTSKKDKMKFIGIILVAVGVLIVILGLASQFFVASGTKKISVNSTLDVQKKIHESLMAIAIDRVAFDKILEQNPRLATCNSACKTSDEECWKTSSSCSQAPSSVEPTALDAIPTIDLRNAEGEILAKADGSIFLTNEMKPCALKGSPGVLEADDTCQWRVEVRPSVNPQNRIVFDYRLIHASPRADRIVRLASMDFRVNTQQPRIFAFRRFTASGRVEGSRDFIVAIRGDSKTEIDVLVRCDTMGEEVTNVNLFGKACVSEIFGPDKIPSKEGRSSGRLVGLADQDCELHMSVTSRHATCTAEFTARKGYFKRAAVESFAGSARMENLSLMIPDAPRDEEIDCEFKNGGRLERPGPGLVQAELNLCNCNRLACFEKEGTLTVSDNNHFQESRHKRVKTLSSDIWIELRNAESNVGVAQISISRPK